MFYSQFILAKKGPLGTIWIAAHLERKLRKNQVADTDIGDSVDSILSPDVPIALRLSSHLLLGVVRIYSRKVNYLFDDCSEALLKIKQAFRSAAVDLPPEESKAPYHSITLPETFDLDDFELPDNDIFQSNFVDHHISSREQITLQDTMEGVSYSTSKFGLDERFGDGDASGLDLDEELFLHKIGTAGQVNESVDPQASAVSMTPPKQDEQPESRMLTSETGVDVDDNANLMDYAQAPCTPGLVDEPNFSNAQEISACDDHLESECHLRGPTMEEKTKNTDEDKQEVDWCSINSKNSDATPMVQTEENGYQRASMDTDLLKQQGEIPIEGIVEHISVEKSKSGSKPTSHLLDSALNPASKLVDQMTEATDVPSVDGLQNGSGSKDGDSSLPVDKPCDDHQGATDFGLEKSASDVSGLTSTCHQASKGFSANDHESLVVEVPGSVDAEIDREKLCQTASNLDSENQDESHPQNPDTQAPPLSSLDIDAHENVAFTGTQVLLPCKSNVQPPDSGCAGSTNGEIQSNNAVLATSGGKAYDTMDASDENLKGNHVHEEIHAASREPECEVHHEDSHDKLVEDHDKLAEDELLAPEKLLSVPDDHMDQHKTMLIEESPGTFVDLDEGDAGSKNISGKKRSFTESTLTEQSLNSVESSRLVHFERKVESVPDDDDLLSSILVGRSSVLKVKPTPRLSEATSVKRTRLVSRSATPKRKVLMDDTMVLHGDTIRQQLTNTEDIRRVRKKAPCTLPEISAIQKQHLEDEIFLEPIFSGVSTQLSSLHRQIWDVSRITVCKSDFDAAFGQTVVETGLPSENDEKGVSNETMAEPSLTSHDAKNNYSHSDAAELGLTSDSVENGKSLDTKIENGPGEPNVTSEVRITGEVPLDRDNYVAGQRVDPQLSNSCIKESDEINKVMEDDFSSLELLPNENGVKKGQKEDDVLNSSIFAGVQPQDSIQDGSINETIETNPSAKADTSTVLPAQNVDVPSVELDSTAMDIDNEQIVTTQLLAEKDGDINVAVETEPGTKEDLLSGLVGGDGNVVLFSNAEHEHIVALYPDNIGMGDDGFMNNGEIPEPTEGYQSYMMNTDSGFDLHDQEELNYYAGNNTEFLNVDDDDLTDLDDNHNPDDEEARFTENTGWSSRTRAVSKYLQTLFIKEAEHERKSLSMDNLLTGKSRKEASRMFFEALVLKTRDYIHVEQWNPCDDITIKPRAKLLKSDF